MTVARRRCLTFHLIDVNGIQFVELRDARAESKSNLADHISYACSGRVCERSKLCPLCPEDSIDHFALHNSDHSDETL